MTDRERAKEALLKAMGNSYLNLDAMLDAVILVVDPIIRADERRRIVAAWGRDGHAVPSGHTPS